MTGLDRKRGNNFFSCLIFNSGNWQHCTYTATHSRITVYWTRNISKASDDENETTTRYILFLFSCFPLVRSAPLRTYSHFMEKISSNRSFLCAVEQSDDTQTDSSSALCRGEKEEKPKWNCTISMLNSDDDDDVVVYSREATYISMEELRRSKTSTLLPCETLHLYQA